MFSQFLPTHPHARAGIMYTPVPCSLQMLLGPSAQRKLVSVKEVQVKTGSSISCLVLSSGIRIGMHMLFHAKSLWTSLTLQYQPLDLFDTGHCKCMSYVIKVMSMHFQNWPLYAVSASPFTDSYPQAPMHLHVPQKKRDFLS